MAIFELEIKTGEQSFPRGESEPQQGARTVAFYWRALHRARRQHQSRHWLLVIRWLEVDQQSDGSEAGESRKIKGMGAAVAQQEHSETWAEQDPVGGGAVCYQ